MRYRLLIIGILAGLTALCAETVVAQGQPKIKPALPGGTANQAVKSAVEKAKAAGASAQPAATKAAQAKAAAASQQPAGDSAAEAAIRESAEKFVTIYNAHDAKGVSELFSPKAEFTDEAGNLIKGREAIQDDFAKMFTDNPECRIGLEISSIRILTPHIAIEEGEVRGQAAPDQPENVSNYVAVHVKLEDRWQIASVSDYEAEAPSPTAHDVLEELSWMLGDWVDESPDAITRTSCHWDESGNYLLHEFVLEISGARSSNGTMRIGWDPLTGQLRSWTFDADSGYSSGLWSQIDDEWTLKSQGVNGEGQATSATVVFRYVDEDTMTWRAYDRFVGGETVPDVPELVIKRLAPPPAE